MAIISNKTELHINFNFYNLISHVDFFFQNIMNFKKEAFIFEINNHSYNTYSTKEKIFSSRQWRILCNKIIKIYLPIKENME